MDVDLATSKMSWVGLTGVFAEEAALAVMGPFLACGMGIGAKANYADVRSIPNKAACYLHTPFLFRLTERLPQQEKQDLYDGLRSRRQSRATVRKRDTPPIKARGTADSRRAILGVGKPRARKASGES